jgi:hypothetical protein
VSGTAIWRDGSRPEVRSAIRTGTFDPRTGVLKLEGEAESGDGTVAKYLIEGKLERDTLEGSFSLGSNKGTFMFTRK